MNVKRVLTTRQGHPVRDNRNLRTVGERGPATLENYHFSEKMSHFDRERVPDRVVHARGTGAFGFFEFYGKVGDEPIARYTRAKIFTQADYPYQTPVLVRFSTVAGGEESPETMRDPRGFAVKFYTVDGNWDLVGNNLPVFFIRDGTKFMDLNHAAKPDPVTNTYQPWRFYDFAQHLPETLHMITWVKSPWGIPANYRQMIGSGVNAYKWINDSGEARRRRESARQLRAQFAGRVGRSAAARARLLSVRRRSRDASRTAAHAGRLQASRRAVPQLRRLGARRSPEQRQRRSQAVSAGDRAAWHFSHCDKDYGRELARRTGIDLGRALALQPPLPVKYHPGPGRKRELRVTATEALTTTGATSRTPMHPVGTT